MTLALTLREAATQDATEVLAAIGSSVTGLSVSEATTRLKTVGPNVLVTHRARPWPVLGRQLRSPVLLLLFVTAGVSVFLGEAANALIIAVILSVSIGLGFANEYRAERAADLLHDRIRRTIVVTRAGTLTEIDITDLVPGDVVNLTMGSIVAADMRLLMTHNLSCDESIVTGESLPVEKTPAPVATGVGTGDLDSCVLMGTIVQSGRGTAVVVATGPRTEFGKIAAGLATRPPRTEFQRGLGRFSELLLVVALVLTSLIFFANVLLQRPILDALLFSLAIAVGITPQLLPAVVSTSLATGSRALAARRVLVKRLVCIEDLGDMDMLVTDKTGTLTEGRIRFTAALPVDDGTKPERVLLLGLLATESGSTSDVAAVGAEAGAEAGAGAAVGSVRPTAGLGLNPLDAALWEAARSEVSALTASLHEGYRVVDVLPFDHERRKTSVLVDAPGGGRLLITKGAPEDVMLACTQILPTAQVALDREYAHGSRVVAVATRVADGCDRVTVEEETGLTLQGFLVFLDRPKSDARAALEQLAAQGITVKIATGDNATVAEKVLSDLGFASGGTLHGSNIDAMDDALLREEATQATIFARVSPEQKARIIRLLRHKGRAVGFLGDGVNDALALHQADIGISVESAADVAKDAADVLLLDKDLEVLANGVIEGRRIFANTIKYILMGTSSNFGNMFSASIASVVLPFLPMLPGQILLNNLLYDSGQLALPGDRVDNEQLAAPSHWDIGFIRRFMLLFGPISSVFDLATFALMMLAFHAREGEFQSGWFIESIATQTLIIFAIRTRRVPFFRSRPSLGLTSASLAVVGFGVWLPFSPLAGLLGFRPLPALFFLALVAMVVAYLVCVECAKLWFFRRLEADSVAGGGGTRGATDAGSRVRDISHRMSRLLSRFTARSPQR